jgi:hypothetical protein
MPSGAGEERRDRGGGDLRPPGPTGYIVHELDSELRRRCYTLERYVPSNTAERQELDEAVQACVGAPIRTWPRPDTQPSVDTVFAFDVSSSMGLLLNAKDMETFLLAVLAAEQPSRFVGMDTSVVGYWPATREGFAAVAEKQGGSTALEYPVRLLLREFQRVFVFTDEDGLRDLAGIRSEIPLLEAEPPAGLFLRVCLREDS